MKTSELRIGNRLLHNGQEITVQSIFEDSINLDITGNWEVVHSIPIDQCEPILLTELHLQKIGFKRQFVSPDLERWSQSGFSLHGYSNKEEGLHFWLGYYINSKNKDIEYLHQLQNLYQSVTGEELEL